MSRSINNSGERKARDERKFRFWEKDNTFDEQGTRRKPRPPHEAEIKRGSFVVEIQEEFPNLAPPGVHFNKKHMNLPKDLTHEPIPKPLSEISEPSSVSFFKARTKNRKPSLFSPLIGEQMSRIHFDALPEMALPETPIDIMVQEELENLDYTPKPLPSLASYKPKDHIDLSILPTTNTEKYLPFLYSEMIPIVRLRHKGFAWPQIAEMTNLHNWEPEYYYTQAEKFAQSINDKLSRLPENKHLFKDNEYTFLMDIKQRGYNPERAQSLKITDAEYRIQSQYFIKQLRENIQAKTGGSSTS